MIVPLTEKEVWLVIHGMGLGATFLLAYASGLVGLWSLRPEWVTVAGIQERTRRLSSWYLDHGHCSLADSHLWHVYYLPLVSGLVPGGECPAELLAHLWHGVETPRGLVCAHASNGRGLRVVVCYGSALAHEDKIRRALIVLFTIAFGAAGVAGIFGAFLTKVAPIR